MSAKATIYSLAVAAAPASGPVIVTIAGVDVPILAMSISATGLVLTRVIAPRSERRLTVIENFALTALLIMILFLAVTGQFTDGEPMGVGMAFVWAVGLGFSGMLVIETFGKRMAQTVEIWLSRHTDNKGDDQK